MRVDIGDDPAVIAISTALHISQDEVVGKLHRLWAWADRHTENGTIAGITAAWIDSFIKRKNFASAMVASGWLEISAKSVRFPHFDRHNGKSAKSRAEDTKRKQLSRSRPELVHDPSGKQPDKNGTREEKRREELQNRGVGVTPPTMAVDNSAQQVKPAIEETENQARNGNEGQRWDDPAWVQATAKTVGKTQAQGEPFMDFRDRVFGALRERINDAKRATA